MSNITKDQVIEWLSAQTVLDREVQRQNATVCRTTGLSPNAAWSKALAEKALSPVPVRLQPCWTSIWPFI